MTPISNATILHLLPSLQIGGSETQALRLIQMLTSAGTYRIMAATMDGRGPLRAQLEAAGLRNNPEYPLVSFYHPSTAVQVQRFASYLRENRIAIIQTHDFYSNIFGIVAGTVARVPVRIAARRELYGLRSKPRRYLERLAYRLATSIVANCEAIRQELISEGNRAGKIIRIYNSVAHGSASLSAGVSRGEILKQLNIPESRRLVTMVANLNLDVKDHPTFLRAAKTVSASCREALFVVAGEGRRAAQMHALTAELGIADRTCFIGRCDCVFQLLLASEVGVLTSVSEGLSNSVLEYMSAGLPVVATDVGGMREAVLDGQSGYLVGPGDSVGVADRILRLLQNPVRGRCMGELGKSIARQKFSPEAQVMATLALYDSLLKQGGIQQKFGTVVSCG